MERIQSLKGTDALPQCGAAVLLLFLSTLCAWGALRRAPSVWRRRLKVTWCWRDLVEGAWLVSRLFFYRPKQ